MTDDDGQEWAVWVSRDRVVSYYGPLTTAESEVARPDLFDYERDATTVTTWWRAHGYADRLRPWLPPDGA
jgi:hypothetical protein